MGNKKQQILQSELLKKSHVHVEEDYAPEICYICNGIGFLDRYIQGMWEREECWKCDGLGEL